MRLLFQKLSRVAPFFYGERGAVEFGRTFRRIRAVEPGDIAATGETAGRSLAGRTLRDLVLPGARLRECDLGRAALSGVDLSRAVLTAVSLKGGTWERVAAEDARLEVVDAEGLRGTELRLDGARLRIVNLREARLDRSDLSSTDLLLVDLFGARLTDVSLRGARLVGCDLACALLQGVDLAGADLRGTSFAYADLREVDLAGARVEGCDFRGARGLDEPLRRDLRSRGAQVPRRWLRTAWRPVALALAKGDEPKADRLAAAFGWGTLAAAVAATGLGVASALAPQAPPAPDAAAAPPQAAAPPADFRVGEVEVAASRRAYRELLLAIHAARAKMEVGGGARWPTEAELAGNEYDLDGTGSGTATAPIVPGGLPRNLLSPGSGVVNYCNDVALQGTLTGDDNDWHYCPSNGRLIACGGFSDAPTLAWAREENQVGANDDFGSATGVPPPSTPEATASP
ncbi:pentapeptide repeat-containing protein [Myxococcota bacterium]|nr:pentapeptide repeat-containing protein [Myxococcota bacterium]